MEFTAVILCGKGKELSPLSKSSRSTGIPKALISIANKPMIEYVLDWCLNGFFAKILLVTSEDSESSINEWLTLYQKQLETSQESHQPTDYNPSIEVLSINNQDFNESGSVLYKLYQNRSCLGDTSNFILLPCDFITNLPPQVIIECYRNKNDTDLGVLFHYKNQLEIEDKIKQKIFNKNYTIYSEVEQDHYNLLDIYNKEEIEKYHKSLKIRSHLVWRYPNSIISFSLLNSNIFCGATNEIFKVFDENQEKFNQTYFQYRPISKIIRDLARRSWRHSKERDTIGFVVIPHQAQFMRCNNLIVLMEANRYFMKLQAQQQSRQQTKSNQQQQQAHVSNDSIIGANTIFGEKTNVKRSVIGSNCNIGKKVKINGCLILNNVTIKDDIQLENCIIGTDVIINSKSKLINCNVENTNEVVEGTQSKGDTLLCLTLENLQITDASGDTGIAYDTTTDGALFSESDDEDEDSEDEESDDEEYHDEFTGNEDGLFAY